MKKSWTLAIGLALVLVPVAGRAQSVVSGTCNVIAFSEFDPPFTAVPTPTALTFHGLAQCTDLAGTVLTGQSYGGGDGVFSCSASILEDAEYHIAYPSADGLTRDVWNGHVSSEGTLVASNHGTIESIDHQHLAGNMWVTDRTDSPVVNLFAGAIRFGTGDDPSLCAPGSAGVGEGTANLTFAYAYTT